MENNTVKLTPAQEAFVKMANEEGFTTEITRKDIISLQSKHGITKPAWLMKNTAYDEFYLLAGGELQVSDGQMATPSENAKKSEIKKLFTSTLKQNKDSRVVLNKFISQVA